MNAQLKWINSNDFHLQCWNNLALSKEQLESFFNSFISLISYTKKGCSNRRFVHSIQVIFSLNFLVSLVCCLEWLISFVPWLGILVFQETFKGRAFETLDRWCRLVFQLFHFRQLKKWLMKSSCCGRLSFFDFIFEQISSVYYLYFIDFLIYHSS